MFIKNNIPGNVYSFGWIQTFKAFMRITVPEKDTLPRSKLELSSVVGTKVRLACTTKSSAECVIGVMTKKAFIGCVIVDDWRGKPIYEKNNSEKCLVPKFQRHWRMGKKGKANFDYMFMFALRSSILLVCMWT